MGKVIRISVGTIWGSAFCIDEPNGRVFYTAAHVLKDIGLGAMSATGMVELCDARSYSPSEFKVSVTSFDAHCDLATFTCSFLASPFARCRRPSEASQAAVNGYLFMPGGTMPDCGVESVLDGTVNKFVDLGGCARGFLHLRTPEPELPGMSGSPISPSDNRGYAFGLLNGAPTASGGPPFIFTFI